jgi:hypothetical protein
MMHSCHALDSIHRTAPEPQCAGAAFVVCSRTPDVRGLSCSLSFKGVFMVSLPAGVLSVCRWFGTRQSCWAGAMPVLYVIGRWLCVHSFHHLCMHVCEPVIEHVFSFQTGTTAWVPLCRVACGYELVCCCCVLYHFSGQLLPSQMQPHLLVPAAYCFVPCVSV